MTMVECLVLVHLCIAMLVSYHVKARSEDSTCLRQQRHSTSPKQHSSCSATMLAHLPLWQLSLHTGRHLVHHHPNLHLRLRSTSKIAATHESIPVDTIADADPQAIL